MTQAELMAWSNWDRNALLMVLGKQSLTEWLRLRREFQEALSRYAKVHSVDAVQHRILQHTKDIEIFCWRTYGKYEARRLGKTEPWAAAIINRVKALEKSGNKKGANIAFKPLKSRMRQSWEALLRKYSY